MLPFSNALKVGALLDGEHLAAMKKLRWGFPILFAVMVSIFIEKPSLGTFLFFAFFGLGCTVPYISLLGYQYRDEIDSTGVIAFDLNVAKSGGLWGVIGLSIWSAYRAFFGG